MKGIFECKFNYICKKKLAEPKRTKLEILTDLSKCDLR